MNLHDARALARAIQEVHGCACTVPYGHGPDGYFCRIWTILDDELNHDPLKWVVSHPVDFHSPEEAEAWWRRSEETREAWETEKAKREAERRAKLRRSPLDTLIDRAVGLE